ncbi:MAG TPA: hypothetical protein VGB69_06325 [Edaphobacter sp.]
MNRTSSLCAALLFGSSSLSLCASDLPSQPVTATATLSTMGPGCPVSLQAQHGPGAVVQTKTSVREAGQRLELHWENLQAKDIIGVTILARGYDATPRILPVGGMTPPLKKTFDLELKVSGHGTAITDFAAQSFAAVKWIDLESITYADGTRWNVAEGKNCRISPNGFMLVADSNAR